MILPNADPYCKNVELALPVRDETCRAIREEPLRPDCSFGSTTLPKVSFERLIGE